MDTPVETSYRRRVGVPARGPARDGEPGRDGELPMEEEDGGGDSRFGAPDVRTPRACRRVEPRLVPWGMHRGFRHGMPRVMSGMRSRATRSALDASNRSGHGMLNNWENIAARVSQSCESALSVRSRAQT